MFVCIYINYKGHYLAHIFPIISKLWDQVQVYLMYIYSPFSIIFFWWYTWVIAFMNSYVFLSP